MIEDSELVRLRSGQHPVLLERVVDDHPHGVLRSHQARQQLGAAPAGEDPEEHLGQRHVTHRAGDGPCIAVQGDLDPAAEGGAVHGGERGIWQGADPAEELVAGTASRARLLGADPWELVDIGTGSEDEGLAGEHHAAPVAGLEGSDHLAERPQCSLAEGIRLLPVGTVVDGDEGDGADARPDLVQKELRDRRLAHSHRSQRSAAPMPNPMHRAVRP